ncbi:Biopolymer transport protein ExbD/TolR [Thalassoglobus neptunius]|uniref:Biopolymer transport protein ExbD/TolR n=1 Tax=Thalassoglobus neptunius TaxID=1938619 RepID=A0A5C5X9R3_9PLAN|nr:biopolymer transporter ExbD [Thalassoglobus neptunius]TWT59131.1 Biopolymer transport protein ExbD/TolR [Thalassoglobus neptunius]
MKFRKRETDTKVDIQMSAMIDIVFQLLIFFLLTLKIIPPEGDFNINMPIGAVANANDDIPPMDLKVKLEANPDGTLKQLYFGSRALGNDFPFCFERLNQDIAAIAGGQQGYSDDLEVELDPDYGLHYRYIVKAISACRGRIQGDQQVTYIEKIKFAPVDRPE